MLQKGFNYCDRGIPCVTSHHRPFSGGPEIELGPTTSPPEFELQGVILFRPNPSHPSSILLAQKLIQTTCKKITLISYRYSFNGQNQVSFGVLNSVALRVDGTWDAVTCWFIYNRCMHTRYLTWDPRQDVPHGTSKYNRCALKVFFEPLQYHS